MTPDTCAPVYVYVCVQAEEDEEQAAEQREEERLREVQEQARQNAAANEFLSRVDEVRC